MYHTGRPAVQTINILRYPEGQDDTAQKKFHSECVECSFVWVVARVVSELWSSTVEILLRKSTASLVSKYGKDRNEMKILSRLGARRPENGYFLLEFNLSGTVEPGSAPSPKAPFALVIWLWWRESQGEGQTKSDLYTYMLVILTRASCLIHLHWCDLILLWFGSAWALTHFPSIQKLDSYSF